MKLKWEPGDTSLKINNTEIDLLGDPHMGRSFRTGVPLDRIGDRERMQKAELKRRLFNTSADLHICMGDIFDKFVVSPTVVLMVAELYREAALANDETTYVILRGNHDGSRDGTLKSSFDLLEALLSDIDNLMVVSEEAKVFDNEDVRLAVIPWHPFKDAEQMVDELAATGPEEEFDAVFGHWDIDSFGGENPNLIPTDALIDITGVAVTGHVHKPERREIGGVDVIVTGSMMPYAHGEDLTGETYRTVSLSEAKVLVEEGKSKNMCLRVQLEPGEELDFEIDCLQLQVRRNQDDVEDVQTEFGSFDMKTIYDEVFAENGVSSDLTANFWSRLRASNPDIV